MVHRARAYGRTEWSSMIQRESESDLLIKTIGQNVPASPTEKVQRSLFCFWPEKCRAKETMPSSLDSVSWKIMSTGEQILDKVFNFLVMSMWMNLCMVK